MDSLMRVLKRRLYVVILMVMILTLSSCGKKIKKKDSISLAAGESGITLKDDGKVIYQIRESFDKDYFDKDDLKKIIKEELDEFNKGLSDDKKKAELSEYEVKDEECELAITFADMEQFVNYINEMEKPIEDFYVYVGTYGEVDSSVYGSCDMVLAAEDAKEVESESSADIADGQLVGSDETENTTVKSVSDLKIAADSKVIILNKNLKIKLPGDVIAVSPNTSVTDNIAHTDSEESYIFYK